MNSGSTPLMKILEYDEVDPIKVLELNLLALDFALTPEHAAHIRRTDPRAFPCLAVYAVEDGILLGQVGIFCLPMQSMQGRVEVGGVWAVSTHPEYSGRGVASLLLNEAHRRMLSEGLHFSTLGTSRARRAYSLYKHHGYEDMFVFATASAEWDLAHQPTRLRAAPPGAGGYDLIENIYKQVGGEYFGFSIRQSPYSYMRDHVKLEDTWVIWKNDHPVGYALANVERAVLRISNILLSEELDVAEAVAAVAARVKTAFVQVKISRPVDILNFRRKGFELAHPNWDAFMVKPLIPGTNPGDARRMFGMGTDKFLISWLDTT
jgi:GNAT superfamily N-acetyltransferase